jgi:hypothetical protein
LLGALTLDMPAAEPLSKTGEKLVTVTPRTIQAWRESNDLASQAGLVLRNVGLIEDLRESRRRIASSISAPAKGRSLMSFPRSSVI